MTRPGSLPRFLLLSVLSLGVLLSFTSGEDAPPTVRAEHSPRWNAEKVGAPLARDPIVVYNDWSAYDELSDNIPLTEQLAMKELDEILRLRRFGVRFDYYMMDAFWFDPDGGYRTWRKPNWPNGPDAWIKKCLDNGLLPGLWFGTNELVKINAIREWQSSLTAKEGEMSFFEGGFLPNFMETMQYWYDHGIRMFKFDFVDFGAATPGTEKTMTAEEIRSRNVNAFREALRKFRQHNPERRFGGVQWFRWRRRIDRRTISFSQPGRSALARGLRFPLLRRPAPIRCAGDEFLALHGYLQRPHGAALPAEFSSP